MKGRAQITAPATIEGLRAEPCDPLILCVNVDGRPLQGLTAEVDWRLAGLITELSQGPLFERDSPVLRPAHPFLPCGRLVLVRAGTCTPMEMVQLVRGLNATRPGVCPDDFEFSDDEISAAFRNQVVIYVPQDG